MSHEYLVVKLGRSGEDINLAELRHTRQGQQTQRLRSTNLLLLLKQQVYLIMRLANLLSTAFLSLGPIILLPFAAANQQACNPLPGIQCFPPSPSPPGTPTYYASTSCPFGLDAPKILPTVKLHVHRLVVVRR